MTNLKALREDVRNIQCLAQVFNNANLSTTADDAKAIANRLQAHLDELEKPKTTFTHSEFLEESKKGGIWRHDGFGQDRTHRYRWIKGIYQWKDNAQKWDTNISWMPDEKSATWSLVTNEQEKETNMDEKETGMPEETIPKGWAKCTPGVATAFLVNGAIQHHFKFYADTDMFSIDIHLGSDGRTVKLHRKALPLLGITPLRKLPDEPVVITGTVYIGERRKVGHVTDLPESWVGCEVEIRKVEK